MPFAVAFANLKLPQKEHSTGCKKGPGFGRAWARPRQENRRCADACNENQQV